MSKKYDHNASIIYVDSKGVQHQALVTRWWDAHFGGAATERGCNLVYVTADETKTDPYGAQLERATSVVHKSAQPAAGSYWYWPEEMGTGAPSDAGG